MGRTEGQQSAVTTQVGLRIDPKLYDDVAKLASRKGISKTELMRDAIAEYVENAKARK